jgi:hypothetical protein
MAEKRLGPKRRRSASEWQGVLLRLAASGEKLDGFCRREGILPATLRWWQWRLKGSARGLEKQRRVGPAATESAHPEFTELRVLAAPGRPEPGDWFELRWRDGLVLAIPQGFEPDALARLLSVLEAAGC